MRSSKKVNDSGSTAASSGHPVKDTEVRILSPECVVMSDGMEGEIHVRGPGVGRRIWTEAGPQPLTNQDGWLRTGDRGFLVHGELHVSGRIKETILINGRNYYAHDIEESVQKLDGIKRSGIVAFGRPGSGSEQLVLIAESRSAIVKDALQRNLRATIRKRMGLSVADVVIVSHGTISRTTSGKIMRCALKQRYLAGEFASMAPRDNLQEPGGANHPTT
jgi:fatty-acyl-CoA synthase